MKQNWQRLPLMTGVAALWFLVLLCFGLAVALFESIVLMPLWGRSPPGSFALVQSGTGVPLQRFWMPVHTVITLAFFASLVTAWRERAVRRLLLIGLASYIVMRVWSGLYFRRCRSTRCHPRSSRRGSRAGPSGRGSASSWMSSRSCARCWLYTG